VLQPECHYAEDGQNRECRKAFDDAPQRQVTLYRKVLAVKPRNGVK